MKAGRGYLIRFFDEKTNFALFYAKESTPAYRRSDPWTTKMDEATIFTDHDEATKALVEIKKPTKKVRKKGYLYISKCFFNEIKSSWNSTTSRRRATKLTKPDRHDFLHAI